MDRKKTILLAIIVVLAFLAVFYFSKISKVNYLIPGVPYNGIYTLFFKKDANLSLMSSMLDILGYWGDERFSVADIKAKLDLSFSPQNKGNPDVSAFFKEAGYEVYAWSSAEAGGELKM